MNKQTKALKELLEAVEHAIEIGDWKVDGRCDPDLAINRAKEALEQKEQADIQRMGIAGAVEQLYLQSLEQPSWQGLSDDEINSFYEKIKWNVDIKDIVIDFARAIEQALKQKNT